MENFEIIKQLEDLLEITNEEQRQNISDLLKEIERKGKDNTSNDECNLS